MASKEEVRVLFRECALAILNTGNEIDDVNQILEDFADFQIEVVAESRGPRIAVKNAPAGAFVDGKMIKGKIGDDLSLEDGQSLTFGANFIKENIQNNQ